MAIARTIRTKAKSKPVEDVILFTVHGMRFVIAANAVEEIRNMDGLHPLHIGKSTQLRKVKFALTQHNASQEHVHFVVDAAQHFRLAPSAESNTSRVLVLRKSVAALLVDSTERMTQITAVIALPLAFNGEERHWYRGLALVENTMVPVVAPEAFLNKPEEAVLRADWITSHSEDQGSLKKAFTA